MGGSEAGMRRESERFRASEGAGPGIPQVSSPGSWTFLIAFGLVLLSRIPFLGPGYGNDPDAWRVAWAAHVIATTGGYEASRFPGYPIQEFVCSLLLKGGPNALSGATAVMSALAAGFFALVFRRLGSRDGVLAALALAFAPAFYIVSVQAMDYAWALAFVLAGLYFVLSDRPWVAGLMTGLAIGCRLTSGVWLVPLGLVLASRRPPAARGSAILSFGGSALAVGALAFLPVFLQYGTRFLSFYEAHGARPLFMIKNASVDLWGLPGTLALALAIPIGLRGARNRAAPRSILVTNGGRLIAAWGIALAIYVAAYLRLPIKAAYLIPAIPLTLLLCGRLLARNAFIAICGALIVSPWLLKISQPDKVEGSIFTTGTHALRVGGQPFVLDWLRGPILNSRARTERGVRYVDRSLSRAHGLGRETVVVAWDWLPQIRVRLGGKADGSVRYVYLLTKSELRDLRARGTNLFDMAGAEWMNALTNGVSLRENGSTPLDSLK